ncbi:hypothetical protein EDC19_0605 [Natranaerovirga hydrolytica]|uniref:Uncharacterized protein n=1 Tax=Natranaerovirga hydrolytica TaxID=680378 RepID=A0A4R1MY35_9FIRM|nr:hypothetical protein [Natranaerovirga hydrolytica]TCK98187.1 hypothetical protein EDC19_0605 [Natranaerovirga hydrolytica]
MQKNSIKQSLLLLAMYSKELAAKNHQSTKILRNETIVKKYLSDSNVTDIVINCQDDKNYVINYQHNKKDYLLKVILDNNQSKILN